MRGIASISSRRSKSFMPNGIARNFKRRSKSATSRLQSWVMRASLDEGSVGRLVSVCPFVFTPRPNAQAKRMNGGGGNSRAVSRRPSRPTSLFENIPPARAARPRTCRTGGAARGARGPTDRPAGRGSHCLFSIARQLATGRCRLFLQLSRERSGDRRSREGDEDTVAGHLYLRRRPQRLIHRRHPDRARGGGDRLRTQGRG